MSGLPELLAKHVHRDGDPHRLTLLDERHLRCHDCRHTLVIEARASASGLTSTSSRTPPTADQACPLHGGWRTHCPGCRADALAATAPAVPPARPAGAPMPADFRDQVAAQLRARHDAAQEALA